MGRKHCYPAIVVTTLSLLLVDESMLFSKAAGSQELGAHKKIVFVAGSKSHGYGAHEHYAGCTLLARSLKQGLSNIETVVVRNGWPRDPQVFEGADTVVLYADGGVNHPVNPHLEEFDKLVKQGMGVVCIHYAVEVPKGPSGEKFLEWIGGYFEPHWSVNPHWTAKFNPLPKHPITRGVQPFEILDEWYYHMRFREGMQGITPILTDLPGPKTLVRPDGPHSGNQYVRRAVLKNKEPQHVAWAFERADGGRGFGFTGGHFHWNWGDPNFRKLVLNAIIWTAQAKVPENGVSDQRVTLEDLESNQDYQQPQEFDREKIRARLKQLSSTTSEPALKKNDRDVRQSSSIKADPGLARHTPATALDGLDVAAGLEATLFAAEPTLLSPTNIDIDHLGRVWVCEVVNYRAFRNHHPMREKGDRILILTDTDSDGKADKKTVFYQSPDIDSAHGICVLPTPSGPGTRAIISAGDSVYVLTDIDGDDRADQSKKLFTGISGTQHDHGIHAFVFGPDGKLYFNFGNHGEQICDSAGQPIVDLAGNTVNAERKPYQNGMVFRCNLDGSELETLAWNFRNNWEVAIDSFGTLWQSDNDDDGNQGVRINYVMEFGNYGYADEITGAGWQSPRTNLETQIPDRHWHLNDPGVVPNLLHTGGGSPTGIAVYEGHLLPENYRNTLIHCDAGPNIVRSYPTRKDGAGYTATAHTILQGNRDPWFRPTDVCVTPDGALIIADWYDPGVGGHGMGDPDRGRLFRIAPLGTKVSMPTFDFQTPAGAIQALFSSNQCVRTMAWIAIHHMGAQVEESLSLAFEHADNSRHRARVLWLLGKIAGRGKHYVERAVADDDSDLRIVGLRLARQLKIDIPYFVKRLVHDPSPQVRRECLLALRHNRSNAMPPLWAELAVAYDGQDRWYLEALGIAADQQWDACLTAWFDRVGNDWNSPPGRDILWRSRGQLTPEYLAAIIRNESTTVEELPRYFRAFDFLTGDQKGQAQKKQALVQLAFSAPKEEQKQKVVAFEALSRLHDADGKNHREALGKIIDQFKGSSQFVLLVEKYNSQDHYPELLQMAQADPDGQLGIEAMRALLSKGQRTLIIASLAGENLPQAIAIARALGNSADAQASDLLLPIVREERGDLQLRRAATQGAAKIATGAKVLLAMAKSDELDQRLMAAAAIPLRSSSIPEVRAEAARIFPLPTVKGGKLPPLEKLVSMSGNSERGRAVFNKVGECSKCHIVNQEGHDVGPNLSEIGGKLSRLAMFESIIFPNAGISHNFETYVIITNDGVVTTGLKVSETDDVVAIKSEDSITRSFSKANIDQIERSPISLMPTGLAQKITTQEIVDVVEYLTTLKKN